MLEVAHPAPPDPTRAPQDPTPGSLALAAEVGSDLAAFFAAPPGLAHCAAVVEGALGGIAAAASGMHSTAKNDPSLTAAAANDRPEPVSLPQLTTTSPAATVPSSVPSTTSTTKPASPAPSYSAPLANLAPPAPPARPRPPPWAARCSWLLALARWAAVLARGFPDRDTERRYILQQARHAMPRDALWFCYGVVIAVTMALRRHPMPLLT